MSGSVSRFIQIWAQESLGRRRLTISCTRGDAASYMVTDETFSLLAGYVIKFSIQPHRSSRCVRSAVQCSSAPYRIKLPPHFRQRFRHSAVDLYKASFAFFADSRRVVISCPAHFHQFAGLARSPILAGQGDGMTNKTLQFFQL